MTKEKLQTALSLAVDELPKKNSGELADVILRESFGGKVDVYIPTTSTQRNVGNLDIADHIMREYVTPIILAIKSTNPKKYSNARAYIKGTNVVFKLT